MPKYEELNETQQRLYDQLQTAMKEGENIIDLLLRSSKTDLPRLSKEDLLEILTTVKRIEFEDGEEHTLTPLAYAISLKGMSCSKGYIKNILNVAKGNSILEEVLTNANIKIKLLNGQEYTLTPLVHAVILDNQRGIKIILDVAQANDMLEKVFASIKKDHLNKVKEILKILKNQEQDEVQKAKIDGWLKVLEKIMSGCKSQEQSSVAESSVPKTERNITNESSTSRIENSDQKDTVKTTNKPIIIGSVCGVIAALAVGLGLYFSAALPVLPIIGIAVAAAVLVGLVAGGITYVMSNFSKNLDKANVEQRVSIGSSIVA